MKVSFFGHKDYPINDLFSDKILNFIINLIKTNDLIEFYFGGMSNFDNHCANIVNNLKQKYPNIKSYYITPYLRESHISNINKKLYSDIIYPPIESVPLKFAITKRNEWIIENSDLIIFNLRYTFGGTYTAYRYAKKKNKNVYNIND